MDRRRFGLPLLALLLVAGCGEAERPEPALARVKLAIDGPADAATVDADSVRVHGSVAPAGARVLVGGDEAEVRGGRFSLVVALEAGPNVVDVQATAPRHPAAMTALRVTREVPVEIPPLEGRSAEEATEALEALGLEAKVVDDTSIIDILIPGDAAVCATDPDEGELARTGSRVTVLISKAC